MGVERRPGRKVEGVKEGPREGEPVAVSRTTKQAGEIRARWAWSEPEVWTERMLTALENGVKGGKWFSVIDKVYAMGNLRAAYQKVATNDGAPGVDRQTVEMFANDLEGNLARIATELRSGSYRPQPVRRVWIDKPGSVEKRPLGIPTVRDRVVQAAMVNVLEPIFERDFAAQSYGFRPGRGCKDALRRVEELLKAGHTWVVDADLKSYFDTIPHEQLSERVQRKVSDGRMIELIEHCLKQSIMDGCQHWEPEGGTPQGAVLSPLLSNVYLDDLDHAMARDGYEMVRYADDFVILCRDERQAEQALEKVRQWTAQAGLTLHPEKTRLVDATERGGFDFLGYHFERGMKWPRAKSLTKLKDAVRAKTRRTSGQSLTAIIDDLNRTLGGWFEYFKHSHQTTFLPLDRWIRMRLRSILRQHQGRKGRGRGRDHQRWPNAYFVERGLLTLTTAHVLAVRSSRR